MKGGKCAVIVVIALVVLALAGISVWHLVRSRYTPPKTLEDIGQNTALYTYKWTCPDCGAENITHNVEPLVTCDNCNRRRYLDMEPWDCVCGKTGNQWFECSVCGRKRPEQ